MSGKATKTHKQVIRLGWVSLFTDWASEMSFPLLPLFLTNCLNASRTEVGLLEGMAELTASLLKVVSGGLSDRTGKRKIWALFGYGLSALVKPLLAFSGSWTQVLGIRIADRFGKGIRTSPRDALIAGYSHKTASGRSFGLHRAMDNFGAILGALSAFLLLKFLGDGENGFRSVFGLAIIPGILGVAILLIAVKDVSIGDLRKKDHMVFQGFPQGYFRFLILQSIFSLVAMNYAFMVLKAEHTGISIGFIPLVYLLYNFVYFLFSYPAGLLSDRIGKNKAMSLTYFVFGLAALSFTIHTPWAGWLAFALYGVFMAGFQTISRAMIADMIPQGKSGLAFGIYHTAIGLASFVSLALAGWLWDHTSAEVPFYLGSVVALLLGIIQPVILRTA